VTEVVLDASALLAFLRGEPGADRVEASLRGALISAVNWSEVLAKAADYGAALGAIRRVLEPLPVRVIPFDGEDAVLAAALRAGTMSHGLSLGDRACLALGKRLGLPVLTSERSWPTIEGVKVQVIR
jgi:PIN domain nuclease of toxin-antitoxin system